MFSIGPSNDTPPEVQVEIRAAELLLRRKAIQKFGLRAFCAFEDRLGWDAHADGDVISTHEASGWLAREIYTHDDRETRDADGWPWDPSQPVAGQYEEYVRAAAGRLLTGVEPRITEQTRHDVAASVVRHADVQLAKDAIAPKIEQGVELEVANSEFTEDPHLKQIEAFASKAAAEVHPC